ncbi:hypothetical protein FRB96_000464, partial [Tulasnella sp. 330]
MSESQEGEASNDTRRRSLSEPATGSDSSEQRDGMITLTFSENSIFNTIISSTNDDHVIMYEVSTPQKFTNRVTTIHRLDSTSGQRVFAAEIEWNVVSKHSRVRLGWQNCEWMEAKDWLQKAGKWGSKDRSFTAVDGARYRWHRRWPKFRLTVDEEGDKEYLAVFREPKRNALLKITAMPTLRIYPEVIPSLDYIL